MLFEKINEALIEHQKKLDEGKKVLIEKWMEPLALDGVSDAHIQYVIAQLAENYIMEAAQRAVVNGGVLTEDTTIGSPGIDVIPRISFPVIRTVFANLIANELVSVQPMKGPVSQIFYLKYLYGSTRGSTTAGNEIFSANAYTNYTDEHITDESDVVTGDGASTTITGSVAWTPILPTSVTLTDSADATLTDDGSGSLSGTFANFTSGTISYTTGAISLVFSSAPAADYTVSATYFHDMEVSSDIPDIDVKLVSSPIAARSRKLRARWGMDAAADLQSQHGISADAEIGAVLAETIKFEVDREIINALYSNAPSTTETAWDMTAPTGVAEIDHIQSFGIYITKVANELFKSTRRAAPNWMVCSVEVANQVEEQRNFNSQGQITGQGVQYIGNWKGMRVYKDPYFTTNAYLLGFKGTSFTDTGYVYAPYMPIYSTPEVTLDDFLRRKAIGTRYAKKLVNEKFYIKGTITAS